MGDFFRAMGRTKPEKSKLTRERLVFLKEEALRKKKLIAEQIDTKRQQAQEQLKMYYEEQTRTIIDEGDYEETISIIEHYLEGLCSLGTEIHDCLIDTFWIGPYAKHNDPYLCNIRFKDVSPIWDIYVLLTNRHETVDKLVPHNDNMTPVHSSILCREFERSLIQRVLIHVVEKWNAVHPDLEMEIVYTNNTYNLKFV